MPLLSTWAELVFSFETKNWWWRPTGGEWKHGPFKDKEDATKDALLHFRAKMPTMQEDQLTVLLRGLPPRLPRGAEENRGRLVRRKVDD